MKRSDRHAVMAWVRTIIEKVTVVHDFVPRSDHLLERVAQNYWSPAADLGDAAKVQLPHVGTTVQMRDLGDVVTKRLTTCVPAAS